MPHAVDASGNAEGFTEQMDLSTLTSEERDLYGQWRAAARRGEQFDQHADEREVRGLAPWLADPAGRTEPDTRQFLRHLREQARSDGTGVNALTAETARDTLPFVNGANGNPHGAERQPANGASGHEPSPARGRRTSR